MPVQAVDKVWMNGRMVDWKDATVHVLSHALHYGTGVFEGIRCYETSRGPAIFRGRDHLARMEQSAKIFMMEIPFSVDELHSATHRVDPGQQTALLLHPTDRLSRRRRDGRLRR